MKYSEDMRTELFVDGPGAAAGFVHDALSGERIPLSIEIDTTVELPNFEELMAQHG
jgi:hypothetical protein